MSAALLEAPPRPAPGPQGCCRDGGRGLTLEQRLETTLRSARQDGAAECPVCRAAMRGEGAGARCGACDSLLS